MKSNKNNKRNTGKKSANQELAITVKKEDDISKWFTQVIQKAELIEYTTVGGCMVFRPNSYQIWEAIQKYFDNLIKKMGVKNAYFPLLIPESLLKKEENHIEGFAPEVAWVDYGGDTKLNERLAIRPTSETIIYDSYSKWIRSYRDLPLKLNQWCNIVRWEFDHATPFLRNREFLWQEGHTVFETKEEAEKEAEDILENYRLVYEDLLAIPTTLGRKSEKEKFAGAYRSLTVEPFSPVDGKVIQGCTSHNLGQNFAKAFNITFLDKNQKKQFPYQNSWGISTRSIGAMIFIHSDNKGLVLPPKVAKNKIVIIPLLFKGKEEEVLKKAQELYYQLKEFNPILDDDSKTSAGFKFNKWEIQGIPLRIEIGPRDIDNNCFTLVRRDNGEKQVINFNSKGFNLIENNCLDLAENTKREIVHAIVRNSKNKTILCLDWKKVGWKSFVSGGIEEGETLEEAGRKEVLEETGYKNLKFVKELDVMSFDKFYAPHKKVNRFIQSRGVIFDLVDEEKEKVNPKELEQHEPVWVDENKINDFINLDGVKFFWEVFKNRRNSMEGLNEILQSELNDMQINLFNKAKAKVDEKTIEIKTFDEFKKGIGNGFRCLVPWHEDESSEKEIKEITGAKSSCIPFEFEKKSLKGFNCFYSSKPATCWAFFSKSH